MRISVINHTPRPDKEVLRVIRAVNRQIAEDFEPHWSMGTVLRLEGKLSENPDLTVMAANMRGDAVLYLEDRFDENDPLGFHNRNYAGIPYGFVYTDLAQKLREPWSVTLSHEALEMIADPDVNLLVQGPHPLHSERIVYHWYEMCDAVQSESYLIDGVDVSNFVLPLYFTSEAEVGGRNDFLGTVTRRKALHSFGINPGGYVGFYDPELQDHDQVFGGREAKRRFELKRTRGLSRRAVRRMTPAPIKGKARKSPPSRKVRSAL